MRSYVLDICLFADLSAVLRYAILKCDWEQMGFKWRVRTRETL